MKSILRIPITAIFFSMLVTSFANPAPKDTSGKSGRFSLFQTMDFGVASPVGLNATYSNDGGYNFQAGFVLQTKLDVKHSLFLELGLSYQWQRYSIDGFFNKQNNNDKVFVATPNNYKQNLIQLQFVTLPLKVRKVFENKVYFGTGFYSTFCTKYTNRYKIGNSKFEVADLNVKPFQMGSLLDFGFKIGPGNETMLGGEISYQFTKFSSNQSFHPLLFSLMLNTKLF